MWQIKLYTKDFVRSFVFKSRNMCLLKFKIYNKMYDDVSYSLLRL